MSKSNCVDAVRKRELERLRKLCALPALFLVALFFLPADSSSLLPTVLWLAALGLQVACGASVWRVASRLQRSGWLWATLVVGLGPLGPLIAFARLDALADEKSAPVRTW